MKNKKVIIAVIAVIVIIAIVAVVSIVVINNNIDSKEKEKTNELVGTWEGTTNDGMITTFIFKKSGNVDYSNEYGFESTGTYEIKDNIVTITLELWSESKDYEFEIKNEKLTLNATDVWSPSYVDMEKK